MLDLGRTNAIGERAEGAVSRSMAVAAYDRGAGQREALLGPDDVDDTLALVELVEILDAEILGILRQRRDLLGAFRIRIWLATVGGRNVVINYRQCFVGCMHLAAGGAQAFKGLWRGHLMHEMTININETRPIRLLVNQVVFPDFVVERTWFHGVNFAQREWIAVYTRRMRTRSKACLHRCRQPAEKAPR